MADRTPQTLAEKELNLFHGTPRIQRLEVEGVLEINAKKPLIIGTGQHWHRVLPEIESSLSLRTSKQGDLLQYLAQSEGQN
jgi:hypothetical protein